MVPAIRSRHALLLAAGLLASFACRPKRAPDSCTHSEAAPVALAPGQRQIQTVFVLVMENANWSDVRGSAEAPYLNGTLLPMSAHAEKYYNPPGVHPSEPNYLWMEGGTDYGIHDDGDPAAHHVPLKDHLVTLLGKAGISWRSYQEDIGPRECPVTSHGLYAAKHNPFVFFDDVTSDKAFCIAHNRPMAELPRDLQGDSVARYNFLTPNLCHDMHGAPDCPNDGVRAGDAWLSQWVPRILESKAWQQGGVLFITWDEGEGSTSDGPIGMMAISPLAKKGSASSTRWTHSSLLRTVQTIFGVGPLLCDAAAAKDLSELFVAFP
jgi:hypothetical protein